MDAVVLVLVGVLGAALVAYFAWLGTTVMTIREGMVKMTMQVESLLEARTADDKEEKEGTEQRISDLEGQKT